MDSLISSVSGSWVGRYQPYVAGSFRPCFRASFRLNDDQRIFSGKISDIGPGGDAVVTGVIRGRAVSFVASYYSPSTEELVSQACFDGYLSEDADSMSGRWEITSGFFSSVSGPWQVFRVNSRRAVLVGAYWPPPSVKAIG